MIARATMRGWGIASHSSPRRRPCAVQGGVWLRGSMLRVNAWVNAWVLFVASYQPGAHTMSSTVTSICTVGARTPCRPGYLSGDQGSILALHEEWPPPPGIGPASLTFMVAIEEKHAKERHA